MKTLTHKTDAVVTCKRAGLRVTGAGKVPAGSRWRALTCVPVHHRHDKLLWQSYRLECPHTGRAMLVSEHLLLTWFSGARRMVHDRRWKKHMTLRRAGR